MMTARFERRDLDKAFFWLDLLVVAIFAVALVALVRDAYVTGYWQARDDAAHSSGFWAMIRDSVFLVASLAWIFFRHFRGEVHHFQNPWA